MSRSPPGTAPIRAWAARRRASGAHRLPPGPLDFAWFSWRLADGHLDRLAWHISNEVVLRSDERGIEVEARVIHDALVAELRRQQGRLVRHQTEVLESLRAQLPVERLRVLSKELARGVCLLGTPEWSELAEGLSEVVVGAAPPGVLSVEQLRALPASMAVWIADVLGQPVRG